MTGTASHFIEVDHQQVQKRKQMVCGDVFLSMKVPGENRVVTVLADGLGSGIKASVLATLTTTMAARFIANDIDIRRSASIIMETLPVCKVRGIGYSTFTIVDMDRWGNTRVIEHDNPGFVLLRDGRPVALEKDQIAMKASDGREMKLHYASFQARPNDRIVVVSDGVTQSGLGRKQYPLGWGQDALRDFLTEEIQNDPGVSARRLANQVVQRALANDAYSATDDISCGVIYFRNPRRTLVMTGPPMHDEKDKEAARIAREFDGRKIVCGGTTAKLLSRELQVPLMMDLKEAIDPEVPPAARMPGFELVTEGTITLGYAARMLEEGVTDERAPNAASRLVAQLLDSDIIHFVVGTRINNAHQDPCMPYFLEIRRNVVHKIATLLEKKYLKEAHLQFI